MTFEDHSSEPIRYISLYYDNADSDASARQLILVLRPEWKQTQDSIEFVRFTDGITNTLLKAINKQPGWSERKIEREAILLRAYGEGTDVLIDRERETRSHSLLASHNLAPPLFARFRNGLLYKYMEGNVCSPADLRRPEVWRAVARKMGEWHATLPIVNNTSKSALRNGHLCESPRERFDSPVDNAGEDISAEPSSTVWTVMQQWIDALPTNTAVEKTRQAALQCELDWLRKELGATPGIAHKPFVFSHCDLLSGNVIIHPAPSPPSATSSPSLDPQDATPNPNVTTRWGIYYSAHASRPSSPSTISHITPCAVSFIDYEYATPAPAAFDLANHFAEWGGFDCDYSVLPTRVQRRDFLSAYLRSFNSYLHRGYDEAELEQLSDEVDRFRGVPGFYWGVWALIQAEISQIEFDCKSYAGVRLGEYWAWKGVDGAEASERERRWAQEE